MNWKIAAAKQHLSEIVRRAATEPQILMNRDRPVAVVITPEDFAELEASRSARKRPRMAEAIAEAKRICEEEDYTLPTQPRSDRPNPLIAGATRAPARYQRRK